MENKEFRVLMKHGFLMGKNSVGAKLWLDKCYPDSAPSESTIRKWFAKFRTGHMSLEDDERSGRPKDAVTDENIKKVHKITLNDRKVKLIEIAETLKISKERVGHIMHEYLGMRKLCAKWVPRELTIDPSNQEINATKQSKAEKKKNKQADKKENQQANKKKNQQADKKKNQQVDKKKNQQAPSKLTKQEGNTEIKVNGHETTPQKNENANNSNKKKQKKQKNQEPIPNKKQTTSTENVGNAKSIVKSTPKNQKLPVVEQKTNKTKSSPDGEKKAAGKQKKAPSNVKKLQEIPKIDPNDVPVTVSQIFKKNQAAKKQKQKKQIGQLKSNKKTDSNDAVKSKKNVFNKVGQNGKAKFNKN